MEKGDSPESFPTGSSFRKYLEYVKKEGYELKVYGRHILVIALNGTGVTILNIPKQYHKYLDGREGSKNGKTRCHIRKKDLKKGYSKDQGI